MEIYNTSNVKKKIQYTMLTSFSPLSHWIPMFFSYVLSVAASAKKINHYNQTTAKIIQKAHYKHKHTQRDAV